MNERNIVGVIAISVLLLVKVFVLPWLADVELQKQQIEQNLFMVEKLSNLEDRELDIKQSFDLLSENRKTLLSRSFQGSNPSLISSDILSLIKKLANDADVKLLNQRLGEFQSGTINILPLKIYIEGDVEGISTFFNSIENHKKKFFVEDTVLAKPNRAGSKLKANMQLLVMVVKNDK